MARRGILFDGLDAPEAPREHTEHTCAECGQFNASRGFKPAGWAHLYAPALWSCTDGDCLAAVEQRARERQEAA